MYFYSKLLIGMKVKRNAKESDEDFNYETRGQQVKRLVAKSKSTPTTERKAIPRRPQAFKEPRRYDSLYKKRTSITLLTFLGIK